SPSCSPHAYPRLFPHANIADLSVGRSGERREEKNEPARRRPWGNRPDPPRARLEDGNTVTGAGSTRTSATEPCIAGHHPLPSHAATVKIYRCAPPHRQAAGDACDPLVKKRALECQDMEMSEESGATSKYNDDGQIDDSLQSIQKIRDEILRKESILQERSAQCDMDIQTLLSEGKMTPKAVSIIRKYKETCSDMTEATNSSCSRDGGQSITKRKKLKEALLRQCKELDEICRGAHWILPRYTVLPSVSDG
uniref:Uncharacterized protein n=1 Tax=Aegilops tauschii subsp. strangulata TaxID=200361 RepID=A0A453QYZ2_AEGTS